MIEDKLAIQKLDFKKGGGLIPVVAQDFKSKKVLMLAYCNLESIQKTQITGYAHYWSRSRGKLWKKGGSSGNIQIVKEILVDCDYDSILFLVEQKGSACHTGKETCFHNRLDKKALEIT